MLQEGGLKMNSLIRWRPTEELEPWRLWEGYWDTDFDEMFEDLTFPVWVGETDWAPRVEAYRKNGSYIVKADIPGMKAKDIHVNVQNGCLTIRGERKTDKEVKGKDLRRRELFYGGFQRSLAIPEGLKVEKMKAKYHDGVLEITAPMEKEIPSKEIKVEVEKTA
jgi:HSP20 family protein